MERKITAVTISSPMSAVFVPGFVSNRILKLITKRGWYHDDPGGSFHGTRAASTVAMDVPPVRGSLIEPDQSLGQLFGHDILPQGFRTPTFLMIIRQGVAPTAPMPVHPAMAAWGRTVGDRPRG